MGFVRERTGSQGQRRFQALFDDVKGHRRSAGTFPTESQAIRAWQRAEDRQAEGRGIDTRRARQRFRRYVEDEWLPNHQIEDRTRETYTYTSSGTSSRRSGRCGSSRSSPSMSASG